MTAPLFARCFSVSRAGCAPFALTERSTVEKIAGPQFADCGRPLAITYRLLPLDRAYRPAPALIQDILRQHTTCVASEPAPRHPVELNTDDAGHMSPRPFSLEGLRERMVSQLPSGYRTPRLLSALPVQRATGPRLCGSFFSKKESPRSLINRFSTCFLPMGLPWRAVLIRIV
jgi:hypothetical protein